MKRISILLCSIGIVACTLTGCGKTVPDLTEEENQIITEYAVDVLLKYDKNHKSRLLDLEEYNAAKAEKEEKAAIKAAKEQARAELLEAEKKAELAKAENDSEVVDVSADNTEVYTAQTIEEFYGIEGFQFQYTGCEMVNEYPEMTENETDAFFAMEATPGMKLLIMKFQAINQSGVEQELNMMNYGAKAKVTINQELSRNLLTTMLLNDIRTYQGMIGANEATELIGIVEVPEGTSVSNLSLELKSESGSTTISLQ